MYVSTMPVANHVKRPERIIVKTAFALAALALAIALPSTVRADTLAGTYTGDFNGQPARATLAVEQDAVSGTLDVGGYVYRIEGQRQGAGAKGKMIDQDGRATQLTLQPSANDQLTMLVEAIPGVPAASVQVHLTRGETGSGPAAGGAQAAQGELDPALIGRWVQRDSYTSGDFSMVNEKRVTLFPDGTYRFGPGRVIGGGDAGSFDSGAGGASGDGGRWRTQGQILYAMEHGSMGWEPYARYYVEGNKLLLTFGNGQREIWYRE